MFVFMLLFILYVSGQEADEPLPYDATDTKRISYGDSTWITRKDNAPQENCVLCSFVGKTVYGFRVLCGWLRDQDLRNHFAFYYKVIQDEWIDDRIFVDIHILLLVSGFIRL